MAAARRPRSTKDQLRQPLRSPTSALPSPPGLSHPGLGGLLRKHLEGSRQSNAGFARRLHRAAFPGAPRSPSRRHPAQGPRKRSFGVAASLASPRNRFPASARGRAPPAPTRWGPQPRKKPLREAAKAGRVPLLASSRPPDPPPGSRPRTASLRLPRTQPPEPAARYEWCAQLPAPSAELVRRTRPVAPEPPERPPGHGAHRPHPLAPSAASLVSFPLPQTQNLPAPPLSPPSGSPVPGQPVVSAAREAGLGLPLRPGIG